MNFMEDGTPYYAPYNLKDGSNVRADGIIKITHLCRNLKYPKYPLWKVSSLLLSNQNI